MRNKIWDIASPFVCLLLCLLASTMVGTVFFGLILGLNGASSELLLEVFPGLSLVITLICNLLAVLLLRKSYRFDQVRFGFNRKDWKPIQYFAAALLAAAAGHILGTLIYATGIQNLFSTYDQMSEQVFQAQSPVILLLNTVVAAPIGEELVFRCLIYRRTKAYFGKLAAVILSSLLFGVYHANMIQFIYATAFGVLLVWIYERSGNLLAAIIAHGATNLWAFLADNLFGNDVFKINPLLLGAEVVILIVTGICLFRSEKAVK